MAEFIERKIIIGFITSTAFLQELDGHWQHRYFEAAAAKHISRWCWQYYQDHRKAPGKDIDGILYRKHQNGLSDDLYEEIQDDILPSLDEEYLAGDWDIVYLLKQTKAYIQERRLALFAGDIQARVANKELDDAEALALNYKPVIGDADTSLDLSSEKAVKVLEAAFDNIYEPVITYPKQLGKFWNHQLVKGGFVALLAPEKRGKTFMLLDMAYRGVRQKKRVAFFQAGDMTESQQVMRSAIYLAKKSNKEQYCGVLYHPVRDCVLNQLNLCDRKERECDFGIFENKTKEQIKREIEFNEIKEAMEDEPEYEACTNCSELDEKRLGTVWYKKVDVGSALTKKEAVDKWNGFFKKHKRRFRLATYANGTLSVKTIKAVLDIWERRDGYIPDVIIIDYADLLVADNPGKEYRQMENEKWKALRALSQEKNEPLVVTATQADAASYDTKTLRMQNFSEDKRKYAHVTAMYGLNQDPQGREKKLKLLRINEIVVREGDFDSSSQVYVLQNLSRGWPVVASYF